MEDAVLVPANTNGDRAMMVDYDKNYPFQYWNTGASWMLRPIYEFWKCFGSCAIDFSQKSGAGEQRRTLDLERDILLPLFTL